MAFLHTGPMVGGETEQGERRPGLEPRANPGSSRRVNPAQKMHRRPVMRTFAVLSLFTLAPAIAFPTRAGAQDAGVWPPAEPEQDTVIPPPEPDQGAVVPPPNPAAEDLPVADTWDPYETAADPSQIDWPQDVPPEEAAVDSYDDGYDPQAYAQFQDELSPYGDWIDDGTYGRVWTPSTSLVGADFTPYYSGGHWVLTEYGWTWVSDYSWGWAPFHYGRWVFLAYGWCWVPGTIWG